MLPLFVGVALFVACVFEMTGLAVAERNITFQVVGIEDVEVNYWPMIRAESINEVPEGTVYLFTAEPHPTYWQPPLSTVTIGPGTFDVRVSSSEDNYSLLWTSHCTFSGDSPAAGVCFMDHTESGWATSKSRQSPYTITLQTTFEVPFENTVVQTGTVLVLNAEEDPSASNTGGATTPEATSPPTATSLPTATSPPTATSSGADPAETTGGVEQLRSSPLWSLGVGFAAVVALGY